VSSPYFDVATPMAPVRLLVIDADAAYLDMVAAVLEEEGYDVAVCALGEHAFETIQHVQPALILLDIHGPDGNGGWQLVAAIRADARTAKTPMLICSTDQHLRTAHADCLRVYKCDLLEKPFLLDDLLNNVAAILSARANPM
jgi:DNA-binding response OmpR family regulator